MNQKPIIFISHISEEKEIALFIKENLDEIYNGVLDIFVSSDESSLPAGTEWLSLVKERLVSCDMLIALCSKISVNKPWINYETGAVWGNSQGKERDRKIVPLLHSDFKIKELVLPLSQFNAIEICDEESFSKLLSSISYNFKYNTPKFDKNIFFKEYTDLTKNKKKLSEVRSAIDTLINVDKNYKEIFYTGVKDSQINIFIPTSSHPNTYYNLINSLKLLQSYDIMDYSITQEGETWGPSGKTLTILQTLKNKYFTEFQSHLN